jgi:hypothetical protein
MLVILSAAVQVAPPIDWLARSATTASAVVAAFTGWLAWSTRTLAYETRDTIAAEDRRHMDSFLPHLLLEVRNVPSQLVTLGAQGTIRTPPAMELHVRNIGVGFAQNIVVEAPNCAAATKVIIDNRPAALGVGLLNLSFSSPQELEADVRHWLHPKVRRRVRATVRVANGRAGYSRVAVRMETAQPNTDG